MTIDRAGRARKRHQRREAEWSAARNSPGARRHASVSTEVEGLFNPGGKHRIDHTEWVAVAKDDEREAGAGPFDLDSGTVRLTERDNRT